MNATTTERLTTLAHEDLIQTLQMFQNRLDPATEGGRRHSDALREILRYYSETAMGERQGRYAFPLGTSLGKTQSVVSWVATAERLDLGVTVLVCQEQIESLRDLYDDLLAKGIPAEKVGVIYRPRQGIPACSTGQPWDYQYLLVTHEMIRSTRDVQAYTAVGDPERFPADLAASEHPKRSLVVWDESLIKSASRFQGAANLKASFGAVQAITAPAYAGDLPEGVHEAIEYLRTETAKVTAAFLRMMKSGKPSPTFTLREADSDQIEAWRDALKKLAGQYGRERVINEAVADLRRFLANSQEPVRLVNLRQGKTSAGVISFELQIPPGLQNVVCLDASAAIRLLMGLDDTLTVVDKFFDVKSFETMVIDQVRCTGGNGSWKKAKVNDPRIREIHADLTGGWLPEDAACIIITCKGDAGKRQPIDTIKRGLERLGVDLSATVRVLTRAANGRMQVQERPKYEFLTWGQERATNRYRHCSHFICAGVLRRDMLELAGQTAGQLEKLDAAEVTSRSAIENYQTSEQFYRLQQLAGRGTSRQTTNGIAAPSWGKVYDQGDFTPYAQRGLPGVQWTTHEDGRFVKGARTGQRAKKVNTKASVACEAILECLQGVPGDVEKVSLRWLKQASGQTETSKDVFQSARDEALVMDPTWTLCGQSVARSIH